MTQTIKITLDKRTNIWINGQPVHCLTVSKAASFLSTIEQPFISVSWFTVASAPVSVEKQNATMLRRLNKLASFIGREVTSFDNIGGDKFGAALC